jgi:LysR family glycine cleavage system transcriptional activator
MKRKLPPFAALRAFEAAARHKSLRAASDELLISSSAISHQIRSLEAFIGAPLFVRSSLGLTLTEVGKSYLAEISDALDRLEASTGKLLKTPGAENHLSVHLYDSLAQLWLIPRMRGFLSENPDLRVTLITRPEIVDLSSFDVNVAIQYFSAAPEGQNNDRLFDETITPVCAPSYLQDNGPITSPQDLIGHRLIMNADHLDEWRFWFAEQGVALPAGLPHFIVDSRANVLHAAREGLGIAMNRRPFGDLMIDSAALVEPVSLSATTGMAYFVSSHRRYETLPQVRRFRSWLLAACDSAYR